MKLKIKQYLDREKWLIICVVLIAVAAYGYMVFNFALTGDEEREMVLGTEFAANLELPLGRYGQWLFRLFFMAGMCFTPGYGDLLAVAFLALSAIVWCSNFEYMYKKRVPLIAKCIFCGIYMTVPYATAAIMCYTFINASSMLAILCVSIAVRLIVVSFDSDNKKNKYILMLIALVLETHALSTYQAHASDIILASVVCIFISIYCDSKLDLKSIVKHILIFIGIFVVSFLIYEIISKIIGTSGYTDAFIMWGTDSFGNLTKKLFSSIADLYNNSKTIGGRYLLITVVLFYISIIINAVFNKNIRYRILYIFIGILILPAAYAVSIALGGMTHLATHTAVLLMAGFMWFHIITTVRLKYLNYVLIACAVILTLRQVDLDNRIYYGASLMAQLDMELGYNIGNDIYKVANTTNVAKPVVIVGKYRHQSPNIIEIGMEGRSIFLRKNKYKINYLQYLGFKFKDATEEQIAEANEIANGMPLYPLEGSVIETDDLIIVNLSIFR